MRVNVRSKSVTSRKNAVTLIENVLDLRIIRLLYRKTSGSASFSSPPRHSEDIADQEHSSGCATFDRESGLVILQSPSRYVIVRAPSIQPLDPKDR